jgi:hypothetical protein
MNVLLIGCADDTPPIPIQKMSAILTDIHLAESYAQKAPQDIKQLTTKNQDTINAYMAIVFHTHQVSETAFREGLKWYQQHPKLLDSVYQQVLNTLSVKQSELRKK